MRMKSPLNCKSTRVASHPFISSIRLKENASSFGSSPFFIDLERVLHSTYFRRLQGKTQVWGVHESDFFRTRLTHSLETSHLGRQIATSLGIDTELIEALCLAHDLGHPPFAHEGARLLDYFARKNSDGRVRFDDNAQNLRIIARLASGDHDEGLNPCASMIDGLIKYKRSCLGSCGWYPEEDEIVAWAARSCGTGDYRNPLASIVEIADDLAYACHDLEDAIRAGMIRHDVLERAFSAITDPRARSLIEQTLSDVLGIVRQSREPDALRYQRHRLRSALLFSMLHEILELGKSDDFRRSFMNPAYHETLNPYLVQLPHIAELLEVLKELVLDHVINAPNVQTLRFAGLSLMENYLKHFWPLITEPHHPMYRHAILSLPKEWQVRLSGLQRSDAKLRLLLDYVAGMSDHYLMSQAAMFYNPIPYRAVETRK